jgi:hypothetical protein
MSNQVVCKVTARLLKVNIRNVLSVILSGVHEDYPVQSKGHKDSKNKVSVSKDQGSTILRKFGN